MSASVTAPTLRRNQPSSPAEPKAWNGTTRDTGRLEQEAPHVLVGRAAARPRRRAPPEEVEPRGQVDRAHGRDAVHRQALGASAPASPRASASRRRRSRPRSRSGRRGSPRCRRAARPVADLLGARRPGAHVAQHRGHARDHVGRPDRPAHAQAGGREGLADAVHEHRVARHLGHERPAASRAPRPPKHSIQ